jgi:ribosome-binding factor A
MSEKPEEKSREIIDQLLAAAGIRRTTVGAGLKTSRIGDLSFKRSDCRSHPVLRASQSQKEGEAAYL